jgi:hypothetical protein
MAWQKYSLLAASVLSVLLAAGCSTQSTEAKSQSPKTATTKDESDLFPSAGRLATQVYPDHMMNKQFLPGGTMAEFQGDKGEYREFLVHLANGRNASFLLQDYKQSLRNTTELPDKAALFGTDDGQPTYVFVRGPYLAGIVGLPEDQARAVAKEWSDKLS